MTLENVLQQVRTLSDKEKLALIESTAQMLQESRSAESSAGRSVATDSTAIKEDLFKQGRYNMAAIIEELMNRPNPTPEQMLTYGLFGRRLKLNKEDFKAAEWHPSDEELDNAGLSLRR
jgi:hypothetical protein